MGGWSTSRRAETSDIPLPSSLPYGRVSVHEVLVSLFEEASEASEDRALALASA